MLVVGIQNPGALHGYEKSSKHRKAERLIRQVAESQILSKEDLFETIEPAFQATVYT